MSSLFRVRARGELNRSASRLLLLRRFPLTPEDAHLDPVDPLPILPDLLARAAFLDEPTAT
jgi:hypothetical protein